jgi:hypothetical protein
MITGVCMAAVRAENIAVQNFSSHGFPDPRLP